MSAGTYLTDAEIEAMAGQALTPAERDVARGFYVAGQSEAAGAPKQIKLRNPAGADGFMTILEDAAYSQGYATALATAEQQLVEALELLKEVDTAVSGELLDRIIAFITAHIAAHGGAKP